MNGATKLPVPQLAALNHRKDDDNENEICAMRDASVHRFHDCRRATGFSQLAARVSRSITRMPGVLTMPTRLRTQYWRK